jgi:hypothetical protein
MSLYIVTPSLCNTSSNLGFLHGIKGLVFLLSPPTATTSLLQPPTAVMPRFSPNPPQPPASYPNSRRPCSNVAPRSSLPEGDTIPVAGPPLPPPDLVPVWPWRPRALLLASPGGRRPRSTPQRRHRRDHGRLPAPCSITTVRQRGDFNSSAPTFGLYSSLIVCGAPLRLRGMLDYMCRHHCWAAGLKGK